MDKRPYDFPLQMSAPMVLALLRQVRGKPGGKTQTRRFETPILRNVERAQAEGRPVRAYVREHWQAWPEYNNLKPLQMYGIPIEALLYTADRRGALWDAKQRRAMHMPRWASRLTLLDVSIRRERLGDMSEADALAEGMFPIHHGDGQYYWHWEPRDPSPKDWCYPDDAYKALWNHLHGPGAWDRNLDREVMVLTFRPVLANIDAEAA